MYPGIKYKRLIEKIDKNNMKLTGSEKAIVKEALDKMFTRYSIAANGIVSMVKLTADKKTFEKIRVLIDKAKLRAKEGKMPLTPADRKKLRECLSYLKTESIERISRSIERGSYMFLLLLDQRLAQVDVEEIEKLQRIIQKL